MSEPNTAAAAASAIVAGSLATLFPQYILIIGGGLGGALWALWGAEQMTRRQGVIFVLRSLLPAVAFAGVAAEFVSRKIGIELREAFAPVSFSIAAFHRQLAALALIAVKTAARKQ
jgi:hypothetical protein